MPLRKTYFCMKCKHIHVVNSEIGRKHAMFNDKNELQLDKFGVIK